MILILSPAYGHDYKNKKEVMKGWDDKKDFIIETITHPNCGAYCNKEDVENEIKKTGKPISINIRYKKKTQVHVFTVK